MNKIISLIIICFSYNCFAQTKVINAKYIDDNIKVDGILNESEWTLADEGFDFIQFFPTDSVPANKQTRFKILYSDDFLYIGATAYAENNEFVVTSLKRDFSGTSNDNITFILDTFNDETNGYFFGVTPYGVKRDGLISLGGGSRNGFNLNWDSK